MRLTLPLLATAAIAAATPVLAASECGMQIQAIERRMQSPGASEVSGKPANPDAQPQASNIEGHAPAPVDPAQKATPEKLKEAQALIDKAKTLDAAGNKKDCEATMMQAQSKMGALP